MRSSRFTRLGNLDENAVQFSLDPVIRDAKDQQRTRGERPIPVSVILLLLLMNRTVQFQDDSGLGEVEVGNKPVDQLLASELPALSVAGRGGVPRAAAPAASSRGEAAGRTRVCWP